MVKFRALLAVVSVYACSVAVVYANPNKELASQTLSTLIVPNANKTITLSERYEVDNLTIPSDIAVNHVHGGILVIGNGKTLIVKGPFKAGLSEVFSGAGTVKFGVDSVNEVYAEWFGAKVDNSDNTIEIQKALNSLPDGYGGFIRITRGLKFNLQKLSLPKRVYINYYIDDDLSVVGNTRRATNEIILFAANANDDGIVNEFRFDASFHPGLVTDVRKDVTGHDKFLGKNQSKVNPVRNSWNMQDESMEVYRTLYENFSSSSNFSGVYSQGFRNSVTLKGIGTNQWGSVPREGTPVTGVISGAKGFVLTVTPEDTQLLWFSGQFVADETVRTDIETTSATIIKPILSMVPLQPLTYSLKSGNWSVGLPPGVSKELFAVGGKIATQRTRSFSQYMDKVVKDPGVVFVESFENPSPKGYEIIYDTVPDPSRRRLNLRSYDDVRNIGFIGAVRAATEFDNSMVQSVSSYNISSIIRVGTGDYLVKFTVPFANKSYITTVGTGNPLDYAYIYDKSVDSILVRVVQTGSNKPKDLSGAVNLICVGGDI